MSKRHYAQNAIVRQATRRGLNATSNCPPQARRTQLGARNVCDPFAPPEDWHEPRANTADYRILVQAPGDGYRHVVTPAQIRERLRRVPQRFLDSLEVIQLSRMTRKKQSFPCYGMQWGAALYLYPIEESFEEHFHQPPGPDVFNEAKMFGGRWD
ncbi:MAG: hypothetical protein AAF961_09825 [Planctomycetota bacterium]